MLSVVRRAGSRNVPLTRIILDINNFATQSNGNTAHWLTSIEAHVVDVEYYDTLPPQSVYQDVVDALKDELISQLKLVNPNYYGRMSGSDILDSVKVRCFLLNQERKEAISDKFEKASEELNPQSYATLWARILQSNDNQSIYDMYFGISIMFDSVQRGAGVRDIKGVRSISGSTYCLAKALWFGVDNRERILGATHKAPNDREINRNGLVMAHNLNLSETESIQSIGTKFLTHRDCMNLRVIVVSPFSTLFLPDRMYVGKRWEYLPVPTSKNSRHKRDANTIFLCYDQPKEHFSPLVSPLQFFRTTVASTRSSQSYNICEACHPPVIWATHEKHVCSALGETLEPTSKRAKYGAYKICDDCHQRKMQKHKCNYFYCQTCRDLFPNDQRIGHRCYINPYGYTREQEELDLDLGSIITESEDGSIIDDLEDGEIDLPDVWAWDIETMFETKELVVNASEGGEDSNHSIQVMKRPMRDHHIPCMVVATSIRDPSHYKVFKNLEEFVDFFVERSKDLKKRGERKKKEQTYLFAHNASGYDTRLLFQHCSYRMSSAPLFRGTKIMRLQLANCLTFLDSMLHICGSLRSIVFSFLPKEIALKRQKGYFPYLFNTVENQDYIGELPEKHYFDLKHMKVGDVAAFESWYEAEEAKHEPYDLYKEMKEYCIQDVLALAEVLAAYEKAHMDVHGLSPLTKTTAASVAQYVYIQKYMPTNTIAQLTYAEQSFARSSLRGGRTDVKRLHFELTKEMEDAGGFIAYRDVCSLYPYVMLHRNFKYPIGVPQIFLYKTGDTSGEAKYIQKLIGSRNQFGKPNPDAKKHTSVQVSETQPSDIKQFIRNSFGFLEVSGHWNKQAKLTMIHPPLPVFDVQDGGDSKCMFHLENLNQKTFCSEELKVAVEDGFVVTQIHRYDHYDSSDTLWKDFFVKFMKLKNIYSKKALSEFPIADQDSVRQKYQKICDDYFRVYGIEMTPDEFEDNPPKKQTFKIILNSLWGKFAQSIEHSECRLVDFSNPAEADKFCQTELEHDNGTLKIDSAPINLFDSTIMFSVSKVGFSSDYTDPLSRVNVAAASFVPMYGRLELYKQLKKLGTNILMHDTDSIITYVPPGQSDLLPAEGKIVGDWEMEDDEANAKIIGFVGLAPKSYALRLRKCDGSIVDKIKCKGITINNETSDKVTYDNLLELVGGLITHIDVPSIRFVFHPKGVPMHTLNMVKNITLLDDSKRKGVFSPDGYLYPYGHSNCGWTVSAVIQEVRKQVCKERQLELFLMNHSYCFEWFEDFDYDGNQYNNQPQRRIRLCFKYADHQFDCIWIPAIPSRLVKEACKIMNRCHLRIRNGIEEYFIPDDDPAYANTIKFIR